jgi:hypothetical protein
MGFDPNRKADVFMTVEGPTDRALRTAPKSPVMKQPRIASEYDEVFAQMTSSPRSGIFSELMLVQPQRWMKGLWGDEDGGWRDARTREFFSFEQMREILDARIKELGLNADLVHAWPKHTSSLAEDQAFWRSDFEDRMKKFRAA